MAKKITQYGMMISLAMILSYVEVLIPIQIGFPGIKLGLANLVVFTALYLEGIKGAAMISVLRIFLVGFTFGNGFNLIYSLAGGALSFLAMLLGKKSKLFSKTGVSILGGIFHNIGQVLIASFVIQNTNIFYYLPVLLIAGSVTGAVIGIIGSRLIHILETAFNK